MGFVKKERLYTSGQMLINGKKVFKYADIIIGSGENYYHAVFLKFQNYFTIRMDDYQTFPTTEIARKVLSMLLETDLTGLSSEKIDKNNIKSLLDSLNTEDKYYKSGNYIVRTEEKTLHSKKTTFLLNSTIPLSNISACITNMSTILRVSVSNENKYKLDKYDRLFFVSADGEAVFKELLCIKSYSDNDNIVLDFITEHEYFLKKSQINGQKISGSLIWTMQVMEYSINIGRDTPIEMRYENNSINTSKKRFFFLFSIQGIKIHNDIRFGLVTLSNESGIDIDRESEYNSMIDQENSCYAQIAVVNNSLRLAAEEAAVMVDKAITLLQILLLDDSPRCFFNTRDKYKTWNIEVLNSSLSINDYFYVEDVINSKQYAILNKTKSSASHLVDVDDDFSNLLNNDNFLEDFFYLKKDKKVEDLLQSIIWLKVSREAKDMKEKVISLYNCVEFLVTGEKGYTLSQELCSAYGSEYDDSIAEIKKVVDKIPNEKLKERINGVIVSSFEGNSSLHSKLETLIERLSVTFETADWDLFDKLKKNRQRLIHNKKISTPITIQELNELFHLFSKLIVYKIIDLNVGGNDD